ncbi:MAG: rhomboid family intramembrane serine protease [Desulfomonile tiedjei]|uniref:Rhomboid family intramembrane serine protease n=1 Tax=Desulfomonile tiedjei TaxID=2358 RepID=A0A9D6V031_9BACT|nr:rhomboid family intramembrane serine protease [Desulfomonile tiedjei]
MIPLRDSVPSEKYPVMTLAIIVVNSLVWFYEVSLGARADRFIFEYGLIPLRFVAFNRFEGGFLDNALIPVFSSIFMHGGWLHVIGNMWFLWIFGDNVEDRLGHFKYLIFYILCGIGASLLHIIAEPASKVPMVGASGAISGILGAYLVSYPHARVHTLLILFVFIQFVEIPAFLFLILWFVFQFMSGATQAAVQHDAGGVAYWAHVGGFVVGIVLFMIFPKKPARQSFLGADYPSYRRRW